MAQTGALSSAHHAPIQRAETLISQPRWRSAIVDALHLVAPLAALALIAYWVVNTGQIVFPNPQHPAYDLGDYYRYVNMALPNGNPSYVYDSPFLYRILVPGMVHILSLAGVPFRASFFAITCLGLSLSTLLIFYLVRGAGLSRLEAACGSLAFVTLTWAVAYNLRDYFLVDPVAQCFIAGILLAVQRQRYVTAAAVATVGALCKENVYLAIGVGVIQIALPYLRPLPAALKSVLSLRVAPVARRIPRRGWALIMALIVGPAIVTVVLHAVLHPIAPLSALSVWRHYIPSHFKQGKLKGLYDTFGSSTWGAYGALFAAALGALALRAWPRGRFSVWALGAALIVIVYSYTVSGDSQRLSILGWPFVILYAAIGLRAIADRLKAPVALLWALVLAAQVAFQPIAGPPGPQWLGARLTPLWLTYGGHVMAVIAWMVVALIVVALFVRAPAVSPAVSLAGGGVSLSPATGAGPLVTARLPVLRSLDLPARPNDIDSTFWISVRGGVTALSNLNVWLAADRLDTLVDYILLPLAMRDLGIAPSHETDPRIGTTRTRWAPVSDSTPSPAQVWDLYRTLVADYHVLRGHLGIAPSPDSALELEVERIFDVASRQQENDTSEVISWRRLSIVLPAYNEELAIAQTTHDCLRAVRRFCPNAEVIVVDDGSRDRTGTIADELAARDARVVVVHNRPNKGYGGALLAGFAAARGDLFFFMDSDGQFTISDIAKLLHVGEQQPGTVVLGYRQQRRDPLVRRLNAWGWKQLVGLVLGLRGIRDIDCAFKLIPAQLYRACGVTAQGAMVNTELLLKLQRMRVPMVQLPVRHFARTHGSATGANPAVVVKAFREMWRLRLRVHQWRPPAGA